MPVGVNTSGGGTPPTKPVSKAQTQATSSHSIYIGLAGELIGVAVLAVFADMNDDVGRLMVVMMAGWFLIFLMLNSSWLSSIVKKV